MAHLDTTYYTWLRRPLESGHRDGAAADPINSVATSTTTRRLPSLSCRPILTVYVDCIDCIVAKLKKIKILYLYVRQPIRVPTSSHPRSTAAYTVSHDRWRPTTAANSQRGKPNSVSLSFYVVHICTYILYAFRIGGRLKSGTSKLRLGLELGLGLGRH